MHVCIIHPYHHTYAYRYCSTHYKRTQDKETASAIAKPVYWSSNTELRYISDYCDLTIMIRSIIIDYNCITVGPLHLHLPAPPTSPPACTPPPPQAQTRPQTPPSAPDRQSRTGSGHPPPPPSNTSARSPRWGREGWRNAVCVCRRWRGWCAQRRSRCGLARMWRSRGWEGLGWPRSSSRKVRGAEREGGRGDRMSVWVRVGWVCEWGGRDLNFTP